MNILSINKFYYLKGGSESVFFNEKEMLSKNGHNVIPFSMQSDKNFETPYSKYFVEEVNYSSPKVVDKIKSASKVIYSFEAKRNIEKLLTDHNIDLSHFHIFQHQISPSVFSSLTKRNIPMVLTLHDLKPICPNYKMYVSGSVCENCKDRKFYNCFLSRCNKDSSLMSLINTLEMYFHYAKGYYQSVNAYIAVSNFYRDKMIEYGFNPNKIHYLPNSIDSHSYTPSNHNGRYILYFGRLSTEKGLPTLLKSATKLNHIPFKIVGKGPEEEALLYTATKQNLKNVDFLGFKSGKELKKIISQATAVVVPSEWYENCPMSILESLASGTPVIGANIGGIPELIEEGNDGFLFPPGDSDALTEAILKLWDRGSYSKNMGLAGQEKIKKKFNAENHYKQLISIYNTLLESR